MTTKKSRTTSKNAAVERRGPAAVALICNPLFEFRRQMFFFIIIIFASFQFDRRNKFRFEIMD